jgi:hypothetical protein
LAGDGVIGVIIGAIDTGVRDGSIRPNVGDPMLLAVTLWGFTHGIIQLAIAKSNELARFGVAIPDLSNYALGVMRAFAENPGTPTVPTIALRPR